MLYINHLRLIAVYEQVYASILVISFIYVWTRAGCGDAYGMQFGGVWHVMTCVWSRGDVWGRVAICSNSHSSSQSSRRVCPFHWVKAIVINSLHVWYVGTGCLVLWYVGTGCLVRDLRMMFDGWTLSQPSIYQPKNSPPHKRPQLLWFVDTYPGNDCSPYCKRRFSLSPFHIYWSIWGMAPIETFSWNYVWPCAN